eukprot:PhF_6_TR23327/c1_g1_i1/m.33000
MRSSSQESKASSSVGGHVGSSSHYHYYSYFRALFFGIILGASFTYCVFVMFPTPTQPQSSSSCGKTEGGEQIFRKVEQDDNNKNSKVRTHDDTTTLPPASDSMIYSSSNESVPYVTYNAKQMLHYLSNKRSLSSCKDIYWCVSTFGFFVPRAPQIEARIAHSLWTPRAYVEECRRRDHAVPVAIDIGVNDGSDIPTWIQVFAHQQEGNATHPSHVFLFEPLDTYTKDINRVIDRLARNKTMPIDRSRIHFYPCAVGKEHNKDITFVGDGVVGRILRDEGGGSTHPNNNTTETVRKVRQVTLIESIRESLPTHQRDNFWIPFLKIDCEGFDPEILLHNEKDIFQRQLVEVVVFELNQYTRVGVDLSSRYKAAWAMMRAHGYRLYLHAIDPRRHLGDAHNIVLVEITELESWPIFLEVMVAIKGTSVPRLLPASTRIVSTRDDVKSAIRLFKYYRSITRSKVLTLQWPRKLYKKYALDLVPDYVRIAKMCKGFVTKPMTERCFGTLHLVPCPECDWVRDRTFSKDWEVDVLHRRMD